MGQRGERVNRGEPPSRSGTPAKAPVRPSSAPHRALVTTPPDTCETGTTGHRPLGLVRGVLGYSRGEHVGGYALGRKRREKRANGKPAQMALNKRSTRKRTEPPDAKREATHTLNAPGESGAGRHPRGDAGVKLALHLSRSLTPWHPRSELSPPWHALGSHGALSHSPLPAPHCTCVSALYRGRVRESLVWPALNAPKRHVCQGGERALGARVPASCACVCEARKCFT